MCVEMTGVCVYVVCVGWVTWSVCVCGVCGVGGGYLESVCMWGVWGGWGLPGECVCGGYLERVLCKSFDLLVTDS